ncbi:MAG: YggT family protein [Gemmatimonadales bacterium]
MGIGGLLVLLITLFEGLIVLRVILSWFTSAEGSNKVTDQLKRLTEPVLEPIRDALPATGAVDLSPLIALVGLELIKRILT